jgi:hypothetical protein
MPRPFGPIPIKPAVLGAANEIKAKLLRNIRLLDEHKQTGSSL